MADGGQTDERQKGASVGASSSHSVSSEDSVTFEVDRSDVCCVHTTDIFSSLKPSQARNENRKLPDIFKEGLTLFDNISKSEAPTNSVETQAMVKKAMNLFEDSTKLVSAAGLFSRNESVDEIPTGNIKYLLLPALLGTLSLKLCVDDRMEVVRTAEVYFRDFLLRCHDYGIADFEMPEVDEEPSEDKNPSEPARRPMDLVAMARERNSKLQRYKEQKELESKMKELKIAMDAKLSDEVERKFYLTMILTYINQSFDEIQSLKMEKPILAHMAKMKKELPLGKQERREKMKRFERKPLKPIIITRDEAQKKVFGAGYPSLPTVTVAEFYDQRVKDGVFPDPESGPPRNALQDRAPVGVLSDLVDPSEEEAAQKEQQDDADDPETLQRTRNWDEWKDDHRRGWGNRMNRS